MDSEYVRTAGEGVILSVKKEHENFFWMSLKVVRSWPKKKIQKVCYILSKLVTYLKTDSVKFVVDKICSSN